MNTIISIRELAPKVKQFEILTKEIAETAQPGQFIILRLDERGERIPLTIANRDAHKGTVTVVFHEVGNSTKKLGNCKAGDELADVVGPLGNPTEIDDFGRVLCVGGGIWIAPLHFIAQTLRRKGNELSVIMGARTEDQLILEKEMREISDEVHIVTDDGSRGQRDLDFLKDLLAKQKIDRVIAMGPTVMMRTVAELTRPYNLRTMVTLAPIMVDGMGMCGVCRVSVGGETKFACMDGPEFDGHLVDFELLIHRQRVLLSEERISSMLGEKFGGTLFG